MARVTNALQVPPRASRKKARDSAFCGVPWFETEPSRLLDDTLGIMQPKTESNTVL